MKLSHQRIKTLQRLLKDELGLDCSDEQAQQAGVAIMRFVVAKHLNRFQNEAEPNRLVAEKSNDAELPRKNIRGV